MHGSFGRRLRKLRDAAGLTQERLAELAGLGRPWVATIESGRAEPRLSHALALYEVLAAASPGLSLEWLLTGQGAEHGRVDDDVRRRAFNRLLATGALMSATVGLTSVDLERMSSHASVDSELLDGWERLTETYASLRAVQAPAELLPMLENHLFALRWRVAERAVTGALWRRLLSITAGTAALAGWVSSIGDRRQRAQRQLDLAEALAHEADDPDVLVLALMVRADLVSAVPSGGHGSLPRRAARYLDEAIALSSPATPYALRVPVLLRRAEEHAYAGQEADALGALDDGAAALASVQDRHHYLRPQWTRPADVERALMGFRGSCLQMVGRNREAIDLLSPRATRFPGDRIGMTTNLAAAHARQGDLDRACDLLMAAADLVTEHGLPVAARRILGVRRHHLAAWDDEPAVAALDERLALIL